MLNVALLFLPQTLESVDVHCFGHLLYEMTYGRPPDSVPVDSFPPASSMAVGQYRAWEWGLLGPGSLQSYLTSCQTPRRMESKLSSSPARAYFSDYLDGLSVHLSEASGETSVNCTIILQTGGCNENCGQHGFYQKPK